MRIIDADALAKRMQYLLRLGYRDAFDFLNEIDAAPTIEAEPVKHGRWESIEQRPHLVYKCSECGDIWSYGAVVYCNYCPYCGAKMDLKES